LLCSSPRSLFDLEVDAHLRRMAREQESEERAFPKNARETDREREHFEGKEDEMSH